MLRIMYTYVVPFLMPAAVYAAWVWYRMRYVAQHGGEAPKLEQGPWPLLLFLGAILAFGVLALSALTQGGSVSALMKSINKVAAERQPPISGAS